MDAAFAKTNTAARLRMQAQRGTLPHAMIFSGAGDRLSAAQYAACAMECTAGGNKPCLQCVQCHKVLENIHPDVVFVRDEEHKEISVDTIRAARTDAFIRPNEGARKIYLFEDATLLNPRDQNTLLKLVEEGPSYAAFFFCTENASVLLQTIRSRCVEIKTGGEEEDLTADSEAVELCRCIAQKDRAALASLLFRLETARRTREDVAALLEHARLLLSRSLLWQYGAEIAPEERETVAFLTSCLTKPQILGTIEILQTYRHHCDYNVGVGPLVGGLAAELEELL